MNYWLVGTLMFVAFGSAAVAEAEREVGDEKIAVQPFELPQAVSKKNPRYPMSARDKGIEGWVQLHFMVDSSGRTYEIEVTDSVGDEAFRRAAVRAAKKYQYDPARLDGLPIDAADATKITFLMADQPRGASKTFSKRYKAFTRSLSLGDLDEAGALLLELEKTKIKWLYEDAYLNLARAEFYNEKADYQRALKFLKRAWGYEDHGKHFDEGTQTSVLRKMFELQLRVNHLADALLTWADLQDVVKPGLVWDQLDGLAKRASTLKMSDKVIAVSGLIDADYAFTHRLLRSAFSVGEVDGAIAEAKLYCDKGFLGFPVEEGVRYTVRDDFADCTLRLIGDPDTEFTLFET